MVFYTRALRKTLPKRLALAMLLAANSFAAWAENRLHIDNFTIKPNEEYVVKVLMENDADIVSLQADLKLPEGLVLEEVYDEEMGGDVEFLLNYDRVGPGHNLNSAPQSGNTYRVIINDANDAHATLEGTTGQIFTFKVRATEALADKAEIQILDQEFNHWVGSKVESFNPADETAVITVSQESVDLTLSTAETALSIRPFATQTIDLSLTSGFEVSAFSAKVKLPKGLTLKGWSRTERDAAARRYSFTPTVLDAENNIHKITISRTGANALVGKEGAVATFDVEGTLDLPAEAVIEVYDVEVSRMNAVVEYPEGFEISVANPNAAAKPAADEAIAKAEQDLEDAIASEREDVKENEKVQAAQQAAEDAVEALKTKINEAYAAGNLDLTDYSEEAAAAEEAADNLVKVADEEEALIDETAVIAGLQADFDAIEVPDSVKDDGDRKSVV